MSNGGWIKLEKDLLTHPCMFALLRNAPALHGVTHALGCVTHLWIIADTHIRNDNVLPIGADQINQLIGIEGFAQALPQDWLQIIDAHHVKLPNFHKHNGTTAKTRALARARQTRFRKRHPKRNARALHVSNAKTSLDQDQDLYINNPIVPSNLDRSAWESWVSYRAAVGKPIKRPSVGAAMRKLASFGALQSQVVSDSIANGYQGLFPPKTPNGAGAAPNRDAAAWSEARALAQSIGFRDPFPQESAAGYLTQAKQAAEHLPSKSVQRRLEAMRGP